MEEEVDAFGNWIDIENQAPNIGVDNNHNSNLITSVIDKEINVIKKMLFHCFQ